LGRPNFKSIVSSVYELIFSFPEDSSGWIRKGGFKGNKKIPSLPVSFSPEEPGINFLMSLYSTGTTDETSSVY